MRRIVLALVPFTATLGFVACGKVASDSDPIPADAASSDTPANDADADVFSVCPPAPAVFPGAVPCTLGLKCEYGAQALVSYSAATKSGEVNSCNSIIWECLPAGVLMPDSGIDGGVLSFGSTLIGCDARPAPICPLDMTPGASCAMEKGNSVCIAKGPGADLEAGVANGSVCACDKPGPVWRCLPLTTFTVTAG